MSNSNSFCLGECASSVTGGIPLRPDATAPFVRKGLK